MISFRKYRVSCCNYLILLRLIAYNPIEGAAAGENPWEKVVAPVAGPAQIYGGYAAGCLKGAVSVPPDGIGYQVVRVGKNRFYGHPSAVTFISDIGRTARESRLTYLVAEMSMPRGGPFTFDHASHQIGLDIDIYFRQPPQEGVSLRLDERQILEAHPLADLDANALIPGAWQPYHLTMLRTAAKHPSTLRIFVHPSIKKKLCQIVPHDEEGDAAEGDWLRKIRPWWGHNYHFHVRLQCPGGNPFCQPQAPPEGVGCGSDLDWWFSDEWRREYEERKRQEQNPPQPGSLPTLPSECMAILSREAATLP